MLTKVVTCRVSINLVECVKVFMLLSCTGHESSVFSFFLFFFKVGSIRGLETSSADFPHKLSAVFHMYLLSYLVASSITVPPLHRPP